MAARDDPADDDDVYASSHSAESNRRRAAEKRSKKKEVALEPEKKRAKKKEGVKKEVVAKEKESESRVAKAKEEKREKEKEEKGRKEEKKKEKEGRGKRAGLNIATRVMETFKSDNVADGRLSIKPKPIAKSHLGIFNKGKKSNDIKNLAFDEDDFLRDDPPPEAPEPLKAAKLAKTANAFKPVKPANSAADERDISSYFKPSAKESVTNLQAALHANPDEIAALAKSKKKQSTIEALLDDGKGRNKMTSVAKRDGAMHRALKEKKARRVVPEPPVSDDDNPGAGLAWEDDLGFMEDVVVDVDPRTMAVRGVKEGPSREKMKVEGKKVKRRMEEPTGEKEEDGGRGLRPRGARKVVVDGTSEDEQVQVKKDDREDQSARQIKEPEKGRGALEGNDRNYTREVDRANKVRQTAVADDAGDDDGFARRLKDAARSFKTASSRGVEETNDDNADAFERELRAAAKGGVAARDQSTTNNDANNRRTTRGRQAVDDAAPDDDGFARQLEDAVTRRTMPTRAHGDHRVAATDDGDEAFARQLQEAAGGRARKPALAAPAPASAARSNGSRGRPIQMPWEDHEDDNEARVGAGAKRVCDTDEVESGLTKRPRVGDVGSLRRGRVEGRVEDRSNRGTREDNYWNLEVKAEEEVADGVYEEAGHTNENFGYQSEHRQEVTGTRVRYEPLFEVPTKAIPASIKKKPATANPLDAILSHIDRETAGVDSVFGSQPQPADPVSYTQLTQLSVTDGLDLPASRGGRASSSENSDDALPIFDPSILDSPPAPHRHLEQLSLPTTSRRTTGVRPTIPFAERDRYQGGSRWRSLFDVDESREEPLPFPLIRDHDRGAGAALLRSSRRLAMLSGEPNDLAPPARSGHASYEGGDEAGGEVSFLDRVFPGLRRMRDVRAAPASAPVAVREEPIVSRRWGATSGGGGASGGKFGRIVDKLLEDPRRRGVALDEEEEEEEELSTASQLFGKGWREEFGIGKTLFRPRRWG
ncbi:hypothetical protein HK101_008264 [Irineochytrium annulatum]|nr:hypothetical protein HK101_008264 [Irineochytrium annulatum]